MELKRVPGNDRINWIVEGDMDEDSVLRFESMITNSYDRGSNITIDLSGLRSLPEMGLRGMGIIARKLEDRGSCLTIVGARGTLKERLKSTGLTTE